jgi:toxin ParE1/3/4
MRFTVLLTRQAEDDIDAIYRYIAQHDCIENADRVLSGLEATLSRLDEFPERGNFPKELVEIGVAEFREAHYKPYRLIYRVTAKKVIVYCVLDGRRDMQSLLRRRLLRRPS